MSSGQSDEQAGDMGYSEQLADRIRTALRGARAVSERTMFGGLAFMVRGNMCVGVIDDKLMVRVGPDGYERALKLTHARPMDFTGKPMRGFVYVTPEGTRTPRQLRAWVDRGLEFAKTLPRK